MEIKVTKKGSKFIATCGITNSKGFGSTNKDAVIGLLIDLVRGTDKVGLLETVEIIY